ncbi:ImmA/IrrE family metallo-endopeptidase [Micromonospora sp. WMMD718]|uniref:ImmA/IrrE family metallo-endopeptidase n=1 Tax=unclassified Micromonospora TaxID=2617518 RepID=UPI00064C482F|nr:MULTISPECIES: ImmA/IrrE family metallo-endopeptidase [unclassified Micromonospora]MDG4750274.1 ImmA/IrrE family metallo-endopeptidase [Micromonospora sp. WMMD718]
MNWLMAHRVAGIAAANLRRRLGLSEDEYVDAFEALELSGLMVMGQDMPNLFGAFVPPQPGRHGGILLNSRMSEATIRHSAAHELGHAEMGHGNCVAEGLDPFASSRGTQWSDEEKQAEAFAAWFLMPIPAVKTTLIRLGLDVPREAMDAYQLSLHLGTSYRGTLRHLGSLRMIPPGVGSGWAGIPPARLRAQLCGRRRDLPARVWDLTGLTEGCRLPVDRGDRLIVRAPWLGSSPTFTGPVGVTMRVEPQTVMPGEGAEFDIVDDIATESTLTLTSDSGSEQWSVTLMATPPSREGLIASRRAPIMIGPAVRAGR